MTRLLATVALTALLVTSAGPMTVREQRLHGASLPGDDAAIAHVLARMGFGPRAGDIAKVRAIGLQAYIDEQLHPERIPDAAMNARLNDYPTLRLSSRDLAEQYERPAIEARQRKQKAGAAEANPQAGGAQESGMPMPDPVQQRANRPIVELGAQKLLRAAYSERQLEEVLTDFWFNHFNVDAHKGPERFLLTAYERDVIRPHVLGKFRDLLEATAQSPAMLFYLDNWMSADPNGPHPAPGPLMRPRFGQGGFPPNRLPRAMPAPPTQAAPRAPRGLNENYGRELMELHTLGVDGGYTQKDVTEVARAFTGWTIRTPRLGGDFVFDPRMHDPERKVVLGHVIKSGGGQEDGEQVLDILAKHPATARFIATKLARHFVSDTPPAALVDRLSARFTETDGNLREVMRTLLTSPEFLAPEAYHAKVKTPFDFIVGAIRVTNTSVDDAVPLVRALQGLGMPLYMCQPPTGYKDTADAWVNTGALVSRMNFALQLASGKVRGATPGGTSEIVETALGSDVSAATRGTIAKATTPVQMTALTLGSPEFQRR